MRGLDRAGAMLGIAALALPRLGVDRARCRAALEGGALATDEVMRRVESGRAFRDAYRDVAGALARGEHFPSPTRDRIISRRRSTGGIGNLGLAQAGARLRAARTWERRQRRRFDAALTRLGGRRGAR
jgi:argininosuccinate lyase